MALPLSLSHLGHARVDAELVTGHKARLIGEQERHRRWTAVAIAWRWRLHLGVGRMSHY